MNVTLIALVGTLIACVGGAMWFRERHVQGSLSNLGAGLLGGAVVSFAVFGMQLVNERQIQQIADRQNLQLTLSASADLRGIDLSNLNLHELYLRERDLREASLRGASFDDANLSESNLAGADLTDTNFDHANLSGARFWDDDVCPRGATIDGTSFRAAELSHAQFENVTVIEADFRGATLDYADFSNANLQGADLRETSMYSIKLDGADLRGADLRGVKFNDPTDTYQSEFDPIEAMSEIDFDDTTRWPNGFDPSRLSPPLGGGGGGACF